MSQAKTQDIIPESGLGPQNSQWRRWVETSITNLKLGFTAFKADIANSFKAVSSSMDLLSRQVATTIVPATASASKTSFSITSSMSSILSLSVPVPDGYTTAAVYSSYVLDAATETTESWDFVFSEIRVHGQVGARSLGEMLSYPSVFRGNVSAFGAFTLSGLSGGSVVVEGWSLLQEGPGGSPGTAALTAQVLFLR